MEADPSYVSKVARRNIVPPPDMLVLMEKHLPGFSGLRMSELALEIERALAESAA